MPTDESKVLRKQLKKTLEAYKNRDYIAPTLRESIRQSIQEEYGIHRARFEQKLEEFKKAQAEHDKLLEKERLKREAAAKGIKVAAAKSKRMIDLNN